MSRCSKCGNNLVFTSETCISCGKTNPEFRPIVAQYTSPVVATKVRQTRPIDPKIRIVTKPYGRIQVTF